MTARAVCRRHRKHRRHWLQHGYSATGPPRFSKTARNRTGKNATGRCRSTSLTRSEGDGFCARDTCDVKYRRGTARRQPHFAQKRSTDRPGSRAQGLALRQRSAQPNRPRRAASHQLRSTRACAESEERDPRRLGFRHLASATATAIRAMVRVGRSQHRETRTRRARGRSRAREPWLSSPPRPIASRLLR